MHRLIYIYIYIIYIKRSQRIYIYIFITWMVRDVYRVVMWYLNLSGPMGLPPVLHHRGPAGPRMVSHELAIRPAFLWRACGAQKKKNSLLKKKKGFPKRGSPGRVQNGNRHFGSRHSLGGTIECLLKFPTHPLLDRTRGKAGAGVDELASCGLMQYQSLRRAKGNMPKKKNR